MDKHDVDGLEVGPERALVFGAVDDRGDQRGDPWVRRVEAVFILVRCAWCPLCLVLVMGLAVVVVQDEECHRCHGEHIRESVHGSSVSPRH